MSLFSGRPGGSAQKAVNVIGSWNPVWQGRGNHPPAYSRLAAHGARWCEQQARCAGAALRALAHVEGGTPLARIAVASLGPQVS